MRYKELFQLEIAHPYYAADGRADLAVMPDRATCRLFQGRGLLLKDTAKGLRALMPVDENGSAISTFAANEVAVFKIFPQSGTFAAVTALPVLAEGEVLTFRNQGLASADAQLRAGSAEDRATHEGFPMVAKVEIQLADALHTRTNALPYTAVFQARSEKWKYYFVSDNETTDLAVTDKELRLAFSQQPLDSNSTDQVGISLRENFPDANLFLFESDMAVPCRDRALQDIQLLREGHVLIQHLPNPETDANGIKIIKIHR